MPRNPRRLAKMLVGAGFGADVHVFQCNIDNDTTATRTFPLFRTPRKFRLRKATYQQEADAAGTSILLKVRNATRALDMTATAGLDAAPLAALAGADFVLSTTADNLVANVGDLIQLVSTVTAGTTAP